MKSNREKRADEMIAEQTADRFLDGGAKKEKGYLAQLKKRAENADPNLQHTRHQQDAVDTAKAFDEMDRLGIYLGLFKRYPREPLIKCREWVLSLPNARSPERIFMKAYRKFVSPEPYKEKNADQ